MKQGLIICLVTLFFLGCNNKQDVRVYLVPKGYEGPLLMIEDKTSKDTVSKRGDTLIFDFTKAIVLRLRGKFIENTTSLSNLKYHYMDTNGNKIEIPIAIGSYTKYDSNTVYLHLQHTQIRANSQCDLISTPKNFTYNFQLQEKLCDSLLSIRP